MRLCKGCLYCWSIGFVHYPLLSTEICCYLLSKKKKQFIAIDASRIGIHSIRFTSLSGNSSVVYMFAPHHEVMGSIPAHRKTHHKFMDLSCLLLLSFGTHHLHTKSPCVLFLFHAWHAKEYQQHHHCINACSSTKLPRSYLSTVQ